MGFYRPNTVQSPKNMYYLYLDHSSRESVSALLNDGRVIDVLCSPRDRSRHPCQVWQQFLDGQGLRLADMAFFACGVGPGSYTGIRSAAATVQAAAFATGRPIIALSSLLLYVPMEKGSYLVVADAGPGGAFVQAVTITEGKFHVERPLRTTLSSAVGLVRPGVTLVSGSSEWMQNKGVDIEGLSIREVAPQVATVAAIAYQEWHAGHLCSARSLPLDYLRKTQVEEAEDAAKTAHL